MTGIGFFAPFPLAMMIPFMAGQSLAMGEAFGKGFQYGKRKISSMTNEEFNALDFKGLSESIATDYKDMIPSLQRSIRNSEELQATVLDTMGKLILDIPKNILDFIGSQIAGSTTTDTSASQLGVIQDVRFTPSHDREADLKRTNDAIKKAQDILDKIIEEASTIVKKPLPPKQTFDNKPTNMSALEWALVQAKNKPFVSPPKAPAIIAHQPSLQKFLKPRAPSSICTQLKKFSEEVRALNLMRTKLHPSNKQAHQKIAMQIGSVKTRVTALHNKYDTSKC